MIKTVAMEFKWPPHIIGGFFIDGQDYTGLEFWYECVKELVKEYKANNKK